MTIHDRLGREIQKGDIVVIAFLVPEGAEVDTAVITDIVPGKNFVTAWASRGGQELSYSAPPGGRHRSVMILGSAA